MSHNLTNRLIGLGADILSSLCKSAPPFHRVFDREYMASWRQFSQFPPDAITTLVDVGAHSGLYIGRAARYFSLSRAVLIEPLPKYASILRDLAFPNTEVVEVALADYVGKAEFTVSKTEQASSLLALNPAMTTAYNLDMSEQEKISVQVSTLDQLAADLKFPAIDLLKIDVQGAERSLLVGGAKALKTTKFIQIEVLFVEHYQGCAQFFEIDSFLNQMGFKLCRLVDFSHDKHGALLQADAIYQNSLLTLGRDI